jgi:hypothetical protein
MDKLERYRQLVRQLIRERAKDKVSHGEISTEAVMDLEKDHYEVLHVGWDGYRRIHGCALHVDIIDGKIWIQHDGTDQPIADQLLEAGVPQEDIVLAFHPAEVRPLTGFAVA